MTQTSRGVAEQGSQHAIQPCADTLRSDALPASLWVCRSGQPVDPGDAVALAFGLHRDLVVRLIRGDSTEIECEVLRSNGDDCRPGWLLTVVPDQLLLKVAVP